MLTAEQEKTLVELGFKECVTKHKSDNSRMFDFINGSKMLTVYDDGSLGLTDLKNHTTYNEKYLSGKFRSIVAILREKGIV